MNVYCQESVKPVNPKLQGTSSALREGRLHEMNKESPKECRSYRQHELSRGCWELNLGLLEEQPVILFFFYCCCFLFQDRVTLCNPGCPGTDFCRQD